MRHLLSYCNTIDGIARYSLSDHNLMDKRCKYTHPHISPDRHFHRVRHIHSFRHNISSYRHTIGYCPTVGKLHIILEFHSKIDSSFTIVILVAVLVAVVVVSSASFLSRVSVEVILLQKLDLRSGLTIFIYGQSPRSDTCTSAGGRA